MGAARDDSWFQPLIWIQYSNFARGLSFPIWVTETNVNATEISQVQLGASPHVILTAARMMQADEKMSVVSTLNQAPYIPLVQGDSVFSDSRAMSTRWSSLDPLDSGFLLERPKGVPMPELTAHFPWVASNQGPRRAKRTVDGSWLDRSFEPAALAPHRALVAHRGNRGKHRVDRSRCAPPSRPGRVHTHRSPDGSSR